MFSLSKYGLIIVALCCGCGNEISSELVTIRGNTMGTTFKVKIVKPDDSKSAADSTEIKLEAEVNTLLREVNRQMSTYQEDSEISLFNRSRGTGWFPVSNDFVRVITSAAAIAETSNGAFDFTIGPLVNLWGFGPEKQPQRIPPKQEIEKRNAAVGYWNVSVRLNPPALRKNLPEIYCDLSAIAKGFGVDKVADYLENLGFENYLVEIGGEVRTRGSNQSGKPWRIGIETPDSPDGIQKVVALGTGALATSGDYFNYFEEDGVRYSHTIDPRTGHPITHKLASVTVLHKSCTSADGLATAINVLGPVQGYELALKENLAVFMLIRNGQGFIEKMTPKFETSFLQTGKSKLSDTGS